MTPDLIDAVEGLARPEHESLRALLDEIAQELFLLGKTASSDEAISLIEIALQQGKQVLSNVFSGRGA